MDHATIASCWPAVRLKMGPLIAQVMRHAQNWPDHVAIVVGKTRISYADLVCEIAHRMQTLASADPHALTVDSDANMPDKVLDALARLGLGYPIVGATSGSTGAAKSYARPQESWINSFLLERQCFAISSDDCILAHGNLSYSLFFYAVCNALYAGATVACAKGFRPDNLFVQATELGATVLYAVPTHLDMIVKHSRQSPVPTVRLVLSSGARFSTENIGSIKGIFPNAAIVDFYGASETSFIALADHTADRHLPPDSVGKPFPGVALKIESEQGLQENQFAAQRPESRVGRIWVHSEMLFTGYLGPVPLSFDETTDQQGRRWVTVGDLGWINSEGYLFLVGRTDRTINVGGVKIQPEEIEAALLGHHAVAHAAVVGRTDGLRGERLVAVVQTKASVSAAELIAYLRLKVDDHKIPREYCVVDQWPITPGGKTDFSAVRNLIDGFGGEPL
ncbi:MAG: long-chain fatty acid--CoA ligase [Burkholderiaceae bacterium]|nr:long-chain fatty acid--CoA ligase [Burkholderiaceae bacterium]